MESRYWGNVKTNSKPVTISDGNQTFYFKSFTACANFLESVGEFKAENFKRILSRRVERIAQWNIFYEENLK